MKIGIHTGLGVKPVKTFYEPIFSLSKYRKKNLKKWAILYNWTTTDRMEIGFSSNNWPKRAANTPGCYHVPINHQFPDIRLQFT